MRATAENQQTHRRTVRLWLLAVAALVFITLIVGGATRLTESGLSIVEWKPVTGVLPPISDEGWRMEFEKYRTIPQYQQLNRGMSLDQFKTIYWWEWTHRTLGRLIGVAFLLPFLFFLWRGWIARSDQLRLWAIFGLGAVQGAVGWWMVSSGLAERVTVSPYRLAFHMTLACVIYAALVWTALRMSARRSVTTWRLRIGAHALLILVLLQIYLGALVAGLDAGLSFNTWPLIDGAFIPSSERLWFLSPIWRNFFENNLTAQFDHRMVAYLLWLLAIWHSFNARGTPSAHGAAMLAVMMTLQGVLGIVTLLYYAPILLALSHQALAIAVLTVAVIHAERLTPRRAVTAVGANGMQEARP